MKSLSLALLLVALSILDLAEAGQVGRWSICHGSPPADSFKAPDSNIPAWSPYWNRYGRANDWGNCKAYFAYDWEREQFSGEFYVLRKYGLSETGTEYVWISYRDFIYGNKPCEAVEYDTNKPWLPSYLKQANMKNCNGNWYKRDLLGFFTKSSRYSFVTTCGEDYEQSPSFTLTNAQVLCQVKTARRHVTITHVDDLNSHNIQTKPESILQDTTINHGSTQLTWKFTKTWTKTTSSSYSSEHGWRLSVTTTIESGLLQSAVANWQASTTAEGYGTYIYTSSDENTEELTYERTFEVPAKTEYRVKIIIFKQAIDVGFKAREKFFDEKGNLLGEHDLSGTWKGVTTFTGHAEVTENALKRK